ncbi:hypothetical protein BYT27DRAFT_7205928 [Phlegmacium glaucopus]|nr:hypothetical protein BYT27DRAFT_7205928 [Phlegmacium glaucopus]
MYSQSPYGYQAPDIVVTVFSHSEKKHVCTVHLAGAESVGMIITRLLLALGLKALISTWFRTPTSSI